MPKSDLKNSNFAESTLSIPNEKETESESKSKSKSIATPTAMSASVTMLLNNQYTKTNTKEEMKFTKLNSDNYQN